MANGKQELKYRTYEFSVKLVKFCSKLPNSRIYWVIMDQLLRAGTSIGANVIEAQAGSSKRDFIKYFEIALKSDNETVYWLCLLRDGADVDSNEVSELLKETKELGNILGASLLTLKGKRKL